MSAIEVLHLSKSFGSLQAVRDLSFEVQEGEIFSLLGPNGAGKTTTISILSCLLRPDSGEARLLGRSILTEPGEVKKLLGVVPQEIALYEDLTARENLTFWGKMYGLRGSALKNRVAEILDLIGLEARSNDRVQKYSGGMKRRVNIGVALLHKPRVIYMDEPTVGIDPQSRRSILDSVVELKNQGMTVLYTTHYMEEAEELSDHVAIMDHGELIGAARSPSWSAWWAKRTESAFPSFLPTPTRKVCRKLAAASRAWSRSASPKDSSRCWLRTAPRRSPVYLMRSKSSTCASRRSRSRSLTWRRSSCT